MQGRKRNRKLNFDYSSDAIYFVTICTKNRIHYFGKIENQKMILNEFGKISDKNILFLQEQYPYVKIHNFVTMPNHIHILLEIDKNEVNFETVKIKSLSSLMGVYKMSVSKEIHLKNCEEFGWQRSFHDRIVKSKLRYDIIDNYITKNPENWKDDKFY